MTLTELQMKDIILMENGKKVGNVSDLEINEHNGHISAIIVTLRGRMMGLFGKEEELVVPWNQIITIGTDVILIKSPEQASVTEEASK
ncbi:sporulation protein, YlmC/YmxH family [Terribacillus halophilus]|uniref:Sporulation protein, YlmC/YmxH family n=1 Tax=Terribacillus halophilus TaxID=361279 RepID=A0A1G6NGF3_9BACI|nr:YlmC/YmxH family sporulation protein [Terribacillus halophilus]SDC66416.1 sporulation protein, YlmC/YmxH family [Terribacillus halophilus]